MNTKNRILDAALELFNDQGLKSVTVRVICSKMNISPGNFTYYFRNTDQLVHELFQLMLNDFDAMSAAFLDSPLSVTNFLSAHEQYFQIQHKYCFFYLNIFEIISTHSEIREKYQQRHVVERGFAKQQLKLYIKHGIFLSSVSELDMEYIINVGYILNNFWIADAKLHGRNNIDQSMDHYLQLCCGRLKPYLTNRALEEFEKYFEDK